MTEHIEYLYKYHLSAWFILPACGVSLKDFQSNGFLNTYISEDCSMVLVVVERHGALPHRLWPLIPIQVNLNGTLVKCYTLKIPQEFRSDVQKYKEGRYTEFSEKLKTLIVNHSGLSCLVEIDPITQIPCVVEMDLRLASLFSEHRKPMEDFMAETYYNEDEREEALEIFSSQTELLSKPKPGEFIRLVSVTPAQ